MQQPREVSQQRASRFSRRMGSVGLLKRGFLRDNDRRKAKEATIRPSISERWESSRRCIQWFDQSMDLRNLESDGDG